MQGAPKSYFTVCSASDTLMLTRWISATDCNLTTSTNKQSTTKNIQRARLAHFACSSLDSFSERNHQSAIVTCWQEAPFECLK